MKVILLIRSFDRPEYLKETLESILNSDIDLCIERYIYDDNSSNLDTLNILNDKRYLDIKGKKINVIFNKQNVGCKQSFTDALTYIKSNHKEECFLCTIDNDVVVKKNFIALLMENYDKAYKYYKHNNIILSGFNSSNSHNKKNKNYKENSEFDTFYRKTTIGAVNFFFHTKMIDEIITSWSKRVDWGVMMYMDKHKYPILCLKKSNLNHIGVNGLWSKNGRYDHDENFNESDNDNET